MSAPADAPAPRSRPLDGSFARQFKAHVDVVSALILRDLKTRFGGSPARYVIAVAWPLAHVFILVGVYSIVRSGNAPIGGDVFAFFAVSVLPFIAFAYPMRWIAMSITENKALLALPRVQSIDILVARIILEVVTAFAVVFATAATLALLGVDVVPNSPLLAIASLATAMFLGVGFGTLAALLVAAVPRLFVFVILFQILVYMLSGIVFVPAWLPVWIVEWLAWNPLTQCIEGLRDAYYASYGSPILDRWYPVAFSAALFMLGLASDRYLKRMLPNA